MPLPSRLAARRDLPAESSTDFLLDMESSHGKSPSDMPLLITTTDNTSAEVKEIHILSSFHLSFLKNANAGCSSIAPCSRNETEWDKWTEGMTRIFGLMI